MSDIRKKNVTEPRMPNLEKKTPRMVNLDALLEELDRVHYDETGDYSLWLIAGFEKAEEIVKAAKPVDTVDAHIRGKRSFCLYQANSGEWIAECLREGADGEFRAVTGSGDTALEAVNELDKKFGR